MTEWMIQVRRAEQAVRRNWGELFFTIFFLKMAGVLALLFGALLLGCRLGGVPFASVSMLIASGAILGAAALYAAIRAKRCMPRKIQILASLDACNHAGGLILLASERPECACQWPPLRTPLLHPRLRADFRRPGVLFLAGFCFLLAAGLIPLRQSGGGGALGTLDIASETAELENRLEILDEAQLAPPEELTRLRDELHRLADRNRADDPARSYALLEALTQKTDALSERAETAASDAQQTFRQLDKLTEKFQQLDAASSELTQKLGTEFQKLLEELAADSPELAELLQNSSMNFNALSEKDLAALRKAFANGSEQQRRKLEKLAQAQRRKFARCATCDTIKGLGDCEECRAVANSRCKKGNRKCSEDAELVAFLGENAPECENLLTLCQAGNGGISRGRADAPLEFSGQTADTDIARRDLDISGEPDVETSRLQGRFSGAPNENETAEAGSAGRLAGGNVRAEQGARQTILPEHRNAVRTFFQ